MRKQTKWVVAIAIGLLVIIVSVLLVPQASTQILPGDGRMRIGCKNCLRMIGVACHLYAEDNDGWFPENLDQLVPKYAESPSILYCPPPGADHDAFLKGRISASKCGTYTLVPGLRAGMPGCLILAYDNSIKNHKKESYNLVCIDTSVAESRWSESQLEAYLLRQQQLIDDWKKAGGRQPIDPKKAEALWAPPEGRKP